MSLKVKYGGLGDSIKNEMIRYISGAAQDLLPSIAFLRRPPHPGVIRQYRGRYGFAAVISQTFSQTASIAKEDFRAMRYFHLGHRLGSLPKYGAQEDGS